jgi:hypothetical protein
VIGERPRRRTSHEFLQKVDLRDCGQAVIYAYETGLIAPGLSPTDQPAVFSAPDVYGDDMVGRSPGLSHPRRPARTSTSRPRISPGALHLHRFHRGDQQELSAGFGRRQRQQSTPQPCHEAWIVAPPGDRTCSFQGHFRADDGTRTHDLLHGKGWQAFAPVRVRALKPLVSGFSGRASERERTRADEDGLPSGYRARNLKRAPQCGEPGSDRVRAMSTSH